MTKGYSTGSPMRACERKERVRVELLVAEEHHEMREPRPADLGHRLVRDVGREVDAGDLGPERAGQGRHSNRLVRQASRTQASENQTIEKGE